MRKPDEIQKIHIQAIDVKMFDIKPCRITDISNIIIEEIKGIYKVDYREYSKYVFDFTNIFYKNDGLCRSYFFDYIEPSSVYKLRKLKYKEDLKKYNEFLERNNKKFKDIEKLKEEIECIKNSIV